MNMRWLALALAAALALGCPGGPAAAEQTETVYLRVIARDDSEAAQAEKLRLRDAVAAVCPARCDHPETLLPLIQSVAAAYAPCEVEIRVWTPGGGVPPAPTLYITLGPGTGRNWWGVLYQNAVLWAQAEPAETQPEAEDTAASPGGGVTFIWPLLSWLLGLVGL